MVVREYLRRVWDDLKNKSFLPLKLVFFLLYGGSMTLFPFLTVYMRSLGISETELAFIYLFTPLVGLIGPPITGLLADRIGNFKVFLSFLLITGGFSALLFLAVPVARIKHDLPDLLPFNMTCSSPDLPPDLALEIPYECNLRNETAEIQLSIQYCQSCGSLVEDFCATSEAPSDCYSSSLPFQSSTLQATVNHGLGTPSDNPGTEGNGDTKYERKFLLAKDFKCPVLEYVESSQAITAGGSIEYSPQPSCVLSCSAVANRSDLCLNTNTITAINPQRTFFIYLAVRLYNGVLIATSFTLYTGAVMAVLRKVDGDYGLQKLYSNFGCMVLTPISGMLIDYVSKINGFQDFRPAFYLYCSLKVLCGIIILFIDLDFRIPNTTILRDCKILFKNFEIIVFLLIMIISGIFVGLLDTFLFWFLQDLGADKKLMGLTVTAGYVAGVPILMVADPIIKRLGHVNTIVLGLLVFVVRLTGYSLMKNPWTVMPFEALESITTSLSGAAAVTYAGMLASPSTLATLQGLYGGLHFGVGNGLGSLIGGFLLKPFGPRKTFLFMAVASGAAGILYFLLYISCFRRSRGHAKEGQPEVNKEGAIDDLEGKTSARKNLGQIESGLVKKEEAKRAYQEEKRSMKVQNGLENKTEKASIRKNLGQVGDVPSENDKKAHAVGNQEENRSLIKENGLEDETVTIYAKENLGQTESG